MEKTTRIAICWAAAGAILVLCALGVLAYGLGHGPQLLTDPTPAAAEVLDTVRAGEFDRLRELLSGSPKIGAFPEKDDTPQSMLWYAYLDSMTYQLSDDAVPAGSYVDVTASISCLDIRAALEALPQEAQALLEQKAGQTYEESDIYDEQHNVRSELAAELLRQAASQILENAPQWEQEITLQLVRMDDRWQVMPGDGLTKLLSGFLSG